MGQVGGERPRPREGDKCYFRPRIPVSERPQCARGGDEVSEVQTAEHHELLQPHRKTPAGMVDARSNCRAASTTLWGAMPVRHSWPMGQTRL